MTKIIISLFSKIPVGFRFMAWALLGFLAFLSTATINSHWADKTGNGLWYILSGILWFLFADIVIYAYQESKK
jgi:sterol desaturase/sphingolipid hydroxylase (fatty acid hydroxylase superfamily)